MTLRDLPDDADATGFADISQVINSAHLSALNDDQSGRARLLATAVELVATHGPASLRVTEVAERAGVSIGLIAHHFGGRQGLVAEAQVVLFEGALSEDLNALETLLEISQDRAFLLEGFRKITERLLDPKRIPVRAMRLSALGSSHGTAELRERLRHSTTRILDRFDAFAVRLQDAGILRRDRDARAIVTFVQAYGLGMVIADLDLNPSPVDEMVEVVDGVLESILAPEP